MGPLRIIILIILFYIGYRLIAGGKKKDTAGSSARQTTAQQSSTDILEEDPVCKKLVPRQQAVQYEHQGETHFFCSKECCKVYKSQQGDKQ